MSRTIIVNNHRVIVADRIEFVAALDNPLLCHLCGRDCYMDEKMYFVALLNVAYCKSCFDLWAGGCDTMHRCDLAKETKHYEEMRAKLDSIGCWDAVA